MRSLLVFGLSLALAGLSGCERGSPPRATKQVTNPKAFEGKVFEADYREAWCNRTQADWLELKRLSEPAAAPAEPRAELESKQTTLAREAGIVAARRATEAPILASTKGRVRRDGDVLIASGARFRDNAEEGDTSVFYVYAGRLPNARFDVLAATHWEWSSWTLVDARGVSAALSGPPVASPNGRVFAATGDDYEGESFLGVEITEYTDGAFKRFELDARVPCNPRWIDNDTLEVKVFPGWGAFQMNPEGARPSDWKTARVVRDGKGWKLIPPAA